MQTGVADEAGKSDCSIRIVTDLSVTADIAVALRERVSFSFALFNIKIWAAYDQSRPSSFIFGIMVVKLFAFQNGKPARR